MMKCFFKYLMPGLMIVLLASVSVFAQSDNRCEHYDLIMVNSPALADEGLDLSAARCMTIHVVDDNDMITHVFVIPESLVGSYLAGADLSGLDFSFGDLSYANLRGATLDTIDLTGTMLIETDLSNAIVTDAILVDSYFNFAVLVETDLSNSDLTGAEFDGADMRAAILDNVTGYVSE